MEVVMRKLHYPKEVMASWRSCVKAGLPPNPESTAAHIRAKDFQTLCEQNAVLILTFQHYAESIADTIPSDTAFVLTDSSGILLKKNYRGREFMLQ